MRRRHGALVAALVISAACQAFVIWRSPVIAKDAMGFIQIAQGLAIDPAATMRANDQHPGYPAMLLACQRACRWLTGADEFASFLIGARIAPALCGLLSLVFLWLFARRLYDERIANLTVLLAAVWPLLRLNASDGLSDTPHLMFYLAGVWLACEGLARRRAGWFVAAGVASGLAFWVRPEGMMVAAIAAVAVCAAAIGQLWRRLGPARRRAHQPELNLNANPQASLFFYPLSLIALASATVIVVAPYPLIAGKITSKKLPFHQPPPSAHAVAIATVEPTPGLLADPGPGGTLPDEFRRPSKLVLVVAFGLAELGTELAQGFYYLALIPLAAGAFFPGRQKPNPQLATLHVLLMNGYAALLMLLYLRAGYISHRHVIPLVALMLPATAAGTVWLAEGAARRLPVIGSPRRAFVVGVGLFYLGLLPKCLTPLQSSYRPILRAAEWVKSQAQPGDCVLSTSGYVRFYSRLPGILVGSEAPNLPIAFHFAPEGKWSFIVLEIDERTFDRHAVGGFGVDYEEVFELAAHPRKPWAKVAVFRARRQGEATARIATAPGPRD